MEGEVREELDGLLAYAKAVGDRARREPDDHGSVDGGRGYIGGALTTLHHLDLLTDAEHNEWWSRLMAELPPTEWVVVESSDVVLGADDPPRPD